MFAEVAGAPAANPPTMFRVSPNFLEMVPPLFPAKFNGVSRTSLIAPEIVVCVVPPIGPVVNFPSGLTVVVPPMIPAVVVATLLITP